MAKLLTSTDVKGKAGVWRLFSKDTNRSYGTDYLNNIMASDGKTSWLVADGKFQCENAPSPVWLYEPMRARWQNYVRGKPAKAALPKSGISTPLVLLCSIS